MNKSKNWYIIPSAVLPYLVLCALVLIFFSSSNPLCIYIMERVFNNNIWNLIAVLVIYCVLATVLSVVCFVESVAKKWDALSLAKSAMIVKLFQVPAYILIFILGVLLVISVFTFGVTVVLYLLDCWFLVLSGLVTVSAVINAVRQGMYGRKKAVLTIVLQLFFCVDVIASIVFYLKLRKRYNT